MSRMKQVKIYEPYAGTTIEEATAEGIAIAEEKDCYVRFNFNGVQIECYSFSTVEELVDFYHQQIKKKRGNFEFDEQINRYHNDPEFHTLVNILYDFLYKGRFSIVELKAAAIFAANKFAMEQGPKIHHREVNK